MINERKDKCDRCRNEFWILIRVGFGYYCSVCAKVIAKLSAKKNKKSQNPSSKLDL